MDRAPIAFFAYKRPWHTEQALESLSRCKGALESELYVFCDGARGPADEGAVVEVRRLVRSRPWCGRVNVIERVKNLGLSRSVITGISELIERHGRVIVVEDDLVLSRHFLNFMNDALVFYEAEPRVMHISGYMFPVEAILPETFFYRATSCWGWATWKRAWEHFQSDAGELISEIGESRDRIRAFDIMGSMNYFRMLRQQARGVIDSWAIRWYASVFLADGLCLHPGRSLVQNIGHDCTGEHCDMSDSFRVTLNQNRITDFSHDICESEDAMEAMAKFYRAMRSPSRRLKNLLRRLFPIPKA